MIKKMIAVALCGTMIVCAAVTYAQMQDTYTVYLPITMTALPDPEISDVTFYYSTSCSGDMIEVEPSSTVNNARRIGVSAVAENAAGSTYRLEWWENNNLYIFGIPGTINFNSQQLDGQGLVYGQIGEGCQNVFPDLTFEVRIFLDDERVRTEKIFTRDQPTRKSEKNGDLSTFSMDE